MEEMFGIYEEVMRVPSTIFTIYHIHIHVHVQPAAYSSSSILNTTFPLVWPVANLSNAF